MSKGKIVLIFVIFLLSLALASCVSVDDISKKNNGTGNYPETFDLERPIFSDLGGIYEKDFTLKIYTPDRYAGKGYDIYYTLDSSEPSKEDGFLYEYRGLKIPGRVYEESNGDFVTVVRAACFDSKGEIVGQISTSTYIKTYSARSRYNMPVISLVTDDINLYHRKTGIFENWSARGSEWERPVHIQFHETDGSIAFAQDAGIRLFGGSSRGLVQKSLRITARTSSYFDTKVYDGEKTFNHEIFPGRLKANGEVLDTYKNFVLRNGGNDSLIAGNNEDRASFARDGLAAILAGIAAPDVDNMAFRPAVVYLNGGYYGILNIREREDEHYIQNVYDIEDIENIAIITSKLDTTRGGRYDGFWFYFEQKNGPADYIREWNFLSFEITSRDISYTDFKERFDIDNVIQYYAYNLFICNTDWPHNNVKAWKYDGPNKVEGTVKDGKWRFMFKDQDLALGRYILAEQSPDFPVELYTKADAKNFRFLLANYIRTDDYSGLPDIWWHRYPDSLGTQKLFDFCMKEEEFRHAFSQYCIKLATELLTQEVMVREIQGIYDTLKPEILNHMFNRGKWTWSAYTDFNTWTDAFFGEDSLVTFAKERTGRDGYFLEYLDEALTWYN